MVERVLRVELMFSPGCSSIDSTIAMVDEALKEFDLAADVSQLMVETKEKAIELEFLGSPSVRVNGRDIEPGAEKRQDHGLG